MKNQILISRLIMRSLSFLLAVICITAINGKVKGQHLSTPFQEIKEIPVDKALIYVYRPFKYSGCAVHYTLKAENKKINDLYVKGYLVYYANPGNVNLRVENADKSSEKSIEVEEGKSYFIKSSLIDPGDGTFSLKPILEIISESEALPEIKKCKLITGN